MRYLKDKQANRKLSILLSSEIKNKMRAKTQNSRVKEPSRIKIKRPDLTIQQLNVDTSAANLLTFLFVPIRRTQISRENVKFTLKNSRKFVNFYTRFC